jgi:3-deoxy-manno-octulosonate cytidylyltransferase (CMP-KDO synthetase)
MIGAMLFAMSKVYLVIPARLGSTRLPEKPLKLIGDKPMVQHVYQRAMAVKNKTAVIVATDHEKIKSLVESFGGQAMMTSADIQSGTDRVGAIAEQISGSDGDIFVNVQGDEPLLNPDTIEKAIEMVASRGFDIGTCANEFKDPTALANPNVVKALVSQTGRAIYFSRFAIPYSREQAASGAAVIPYQHQGIYAYKRSVLKRFCGLKRTPLEVAESLEQLRALYYDMTIGVGLVPHISIGVDTPEDLEMVSKLI